MGKNKWNSNRDLMQIILNIVVIGIFNIIENWLLFYYDGSWKIPVIFAVLSMLMCCVLAINIYHCIMGLQKKASSQDSDMQIQALLYKQMKKLEEELEEMKMNQLRSTKAMLMKLDELEPSTADYVKPEEEPEEEAEPVADFAEAEPEPEGVSDEEPEDSVQALSDNDAMTGLMEDPNRELTPDEIAALFAGMN